MNAFTPSREEQAEVAAVLQSGTFQRAPLLENFFRYVCEQYFEGQSCQIKEYSIAVEALGRPPAFDPKKDSIVRVEAHRLRKRLQEYYQGPGKSHAIRILIPNGQYAPQFVPGFVPGEPPNNGFAQVELLPAPRADAPAIPIPALVISRTRRRWISIVAALVLGISLVAAGRALSHLRHRTPKATANEYWTGPATGPVPMEFRMLAGYHGPAIVDGNDHTWNPDCYYSGGESAPIPANRSIEGQREPHWLKAQRSGTFQYDIPLRQGTYELHLYFAETEYGLGNPRGGGDGTRMFHVSLNGTDRFGTLDPLAEAGGPNRLHARVIKDVGPAADGKLHIRFEPGTAPAFLNALEILSSAPGQIRPVRIVTQPSPMTDSEGHVWSADEYFVGGTLVFRKDSVSNLRGKALYQGERYGNFAYRIPLAPGKYRLTLHFAETWFGTPESREPALGNRLFNVFANGVALLRSFEVAKEAGGVYRGVDEVFEGLEPNAQGVLVLEFVPLKNYAEVNAIEVVETD
jgi:hypothetical protein